MEHLRTMQRTLETIERRLVEPLSIDALAHAAGLSRWHFQRIFHAMVGYPVGSYIRRRRLAEASERLRASARTILDVALDFQFESHEAFTRAFKAEMAVTPSAWRRHALRARQGLAPVVLNSDLIRHRYRHMHLTPEILTLPTRTFAGLPARFIMPSSPDANNLQVIPELWSRFIPRIRELAPAMVEPHVVYGLSDTPDALGETKTRPDEGFYLAAVQVASNAELPRGMVKWTSPGGTFARFLHRGSVQKIGATFGYIYGKWLPESGFVSGQGPDVERMDDRFDAASETSVFEILVPVKGSRPKA